MEENQKDVTTPENTNKGTNEKAKAPSKYIAGFYTANGAPLQVVRQLSHKNQMNPDGKTIARTFPTWATNKKNFIHFNVNERTELTEEDMKNPSIRNLVDSGKIIRVL